MNQSERLTVLTLLTLLLFLLPAYLLHVSEEFAGSLAGFLFGAAAVALIVGTLMYPLLKYNPRIKAILPARVSIRGLLSFHAYSGVIAAFLATLHTGHRFQSPIGVTLMTLMLVVIVTGIVGRYYVPGSAEQLRNFQSRLAQLRAEFDRVALQVATLPSSDFGGDRASFRISGIASVAELVAGIADLEREIGSRESLKAVLARWMLVHVSACILLFGLLTLHVAGEYYYGLRWLR